jgi:cytochrome c oxidase subunit IV
MTAKIIRIVLSAIAIASLFLSFQQFENMWANFDAAGFLKDNETHYRVVRGYELIIPIIPVLILVMGNMIPVFVKAKWSRIANICLTSVGLVFVLYLYTLLSTSAEPAPFSHFLPPQPIVGLGYYLLLLVGIFSVASSLVKRKKH